MAPKAIVMSGSRRHAANGMVKKIALSAVGLVRKLSTKIF